MLTAACRRHPQVQACQPLMLNVAAGAEALDSVVLTAYSR